MAKDQSIAIWRNTQIANNAGGYVDNWASLITIWAEVYPKAGQESLAQGRTNATFVNLFKIWRDDCPSLTEKDRIRWNGENWNIRGIRRAGERQLELVIEAERGVAP